MRMIGWWVIGGLVAGMALWVGAALWLDAQGGGPAPEGSWDAIVVAGCRVDPTGQPSLALQRRARLGVQLWQEGRAPVVVFTGGLGTYAPTEARAAADYAAGLGLPAEATLLEEGSTSTEENARMAAALLRSEGRPAERVLLVTDAYHTLRAGRVFRRFFPEVRPVGSQPSPSVRARGALREVLAFSYYRATGKI